MAILPFSYGFKPARGVSGMIADFNPASVDTMALADSLGASSGKAIWRTAGIPNVAATKVGSRIPPGGTQIQQLAGFVVYNSGKPGDPALPEYSDKELVPVCVQGRQWLYVENFGATDPAVAMDSWSIRTGGGGAGSVDVGNLAYNSMSGDFFNLPQGRMRAVEAVTLSGGAALVLIDFDFRRPGIIIMTPPSMVFRGAYAGGTSYNMNDVVMESGGLAPGAYINIYNMGPTTGVLPSSDPTRWTLIAPA